MTDDEKAEISHSTAPRPIRQLADLTPSTSHVDLHKCGFTDCSDVSGTFAISGPSFETFGT